MSKVLFVDDDIKYQTIIKNLLELEGFEVDCASDPVDGIDMFKNNKYDLIISDLIMDSIDGLDFTTLVRKINSEVPIIILTGHEDYRKEIEGFNLDVDDYIYKPTSLEVLLKRIEKTLKPRRSERKIESLNSENDNIQVNVKSRKVKQDDVYVDLTTKEFELLVFLLKNKNVVYTREELLKEVWRVDSSLIDVRTIDTHIRNLRAKLEINSINSVRGVGYEWFE